MPSLLLCSSCLHSYIAFQKIGRHFQYYKERATGESCQAQELAQEAIEAEAQKGETNVEPSTETQATTHAGDAAPISQSGEPVEGEETTDTEDKGDPDETIFDAERIRKRIGIPSPGKPLL